MQHWGEVFWKLYAMCGLTGYIPRNSEPTRSAEIISLMTNSMIHRGPDDLGLAGVRFHEREIECLRAGGEPNFEREVDMLLGFRRLSIQDLSPNGHQPMVSQDRKVVLMMNGEIYNAAEFRSELESLGYCFAGHSDTEVVLNLYHHFGLVGLLARLNGMFALSIYDTRCGKLFLARDRFGIKPLYVLESNEYFAFGSEMKVFSHLPGFKFELDEEQIDEYLIFRNARERTLVQNVRQLPPGFYLTFDPATGHGKESQYHGISGKPTRVGNEAFSEALSKSVAAQLVSDVPVGCQLSGGVDSSVITAVACQASTRPVDSVSVIFEDDTHSEKPYIDQVSRHLGQKARLFALSAEYFIQSLPSATWHLEQPIGHANTIGVLLLSEEARKTLTVLLSGEGADELLGGYGRFLDVDAPWGRAFLRSLRNEGKEPLKFLSRYADQSWRAVASSAVFSEREARSVFPGFSFDAAFEERLGIFRDAAAGCRFTKHRVYEMQTYLPDLLLRQDKMSMARSIENRVPFLDNQFAELALGLGVDQLIGKVAGKKHGKLALKRLCSEIFGTEFSFRRKMGFGIPLRNFFSDPRFRELIEGRIIPGMKSRAIFDWKIASKTFSNHQNAPWPDLNMLWSMIAFELWAQTFLDNQSTIDAL